MQFKAKRYSMNDDNVKFSGVLTAIVTPFSADGSSVDLRSLERLLEKQLAAGVDGVVACGSTGESTTLSDEEYREVVKSVRAKVPKDRRVIAGISVSATSKAITLAKLATDLGVDGLLIATPPYNKPSQEGIYAHLEAVHKAVKTPIIAYNIPGRSGVQLLPNTILKLAREGVVVGVKESSGSLDQVLDILAGVSDGFSVLSGEDSLTYPVMACGGSGVISAGASALPEGFAEIVKLVRAGSFKAAAAKQLDILPFIRAFFRESNPVPVKVAAWIRGWIDHPTVRLPLTPASSETVNELKNLFATCKEIAA